MKHYEVFQGSCSILINSILVHCVLNFINKQPLVAKKSKYSKENSVERRCVYVGGGGGDNSSKWQGGIFCRPVFYL